MTRLFNDPSTFVEDTLVGFLDVHSKLVTGVAGGVVRADQSPATKVAVVVGGGSGHYPAFAGIIGPGFADGAVVGNIFTSPSSEDAYHVAKAANNGAGVIITSGNYAGDVMHFTTASERLNAEGIRSDVLFVTDDIASAPLSEITKRRGIAGDFVVFKVLGAAAEKGYDFNEVMRVGRYANDMTRTLGVAFSGCTLPGATEPLFSVPKNRMGVGLGIHGEPGISEADLPTARELAQLLVDGVLTELPELAGKRIGAILNGLGATKYEELFVVWGTVSRLLREAGFTVIDPEVGELVTSLDMAGCSLTLVSLDLELEEFWRAAATTPAFKKGTTQSGETARRVLSEDPLDLTKAEQSPTPTASAGSQLCARQVLRGLEAMKQQIIDIESELGRLDAIAGDGDHGRGMFKGITAAVHAGTVAVEQGSGTGTLLIRAGTNWEAKAGGTSGALWGHALSAIGNSLGDAEEEYDCQDVISALQAGYDAMVMIGKAQQGDKTMLDAFQPFIQELTTQCQNDKPLPLAWTHAAKAATTAAEATAALSPRIGRARPLAERSVGTPDPGAISIAACITAAAEIWSNSHA
ncbi:MAG: dihydroxyacetone kinase family protein [Actinomycetales bacterium]|nr:dihydroxyacetone kinase family protein [Actinomycetales bacterium]